METLTDYGQFNSEDHKECCRIVEAIHKKAFELPVLLNKGTEQIQQKIERNLNTKEKSESKNDITSLMPSNKTKMQKRVFLSDETKIANLDIKTDLLNQNYKQAHELATDTYEDAQLNQFTIQVYPFLKRGDRVNVYLDFYSKWANRTFALLFSESTQLKHLTPDIRTKYDSYKVVSTILPWNYCPNWKKFLKMVIVKIGPLPKKDMTVYYIRATAKNQHEWDWSVSLKDAFTGEDYRYSLIGNEVDNNHIKKRLT